MKKLLILLRGLPGAGKSTVAKELFSGYIQLETDKYFLAVNQNYNFDASKLKEAHEWCKNECDKAMNWELNIVVSNTFTQEWEMQPYYDLAKKHGYTVFSLVVENRHNGVNEHNVLKETLEKMKNRFEIKL